MLSLASVLLLAANMPVEPPTGDACRADVQSSVRLLILDLAAPDAPPTLTRTLGQLIAREASKIQGFIVLTSDELRTVLDQEAEKQLFGCDDSSCLAEFAGALDADLLVSGQLDSSIAGTTTLSLNLLNTRAIVTMNRVSLTWAGDPGRLPELAVAAALLLLVEKARRPVGAVAIDGAPDDVRVYIDDVDMTDQVQDGVVRGLDVGTHALRLEADGYEPMETAVLLSSSEPERVDGMLLERSFFSSGWLWAGIGVAVVGTALATGALFILSTDASVNTSADIAAPSLAGVEAVKNP
jgi:hypothetical protein